MSSAAVPAPDDVTVLRESVATVNVDISLALCRGGFYRATVSSAEWSQSAVAPRWWEAVEKAFEKWAADGKRDIAGMAFRLAADVARGA